jgi:hypothetical protein
VKVSLKSLASTQSAIQRLALEAASIRESFERSTALLNQFKASFANILPAFERAVVLHCANEFLAFDRFQKGMKRHREASMLVSATLPRRGWYLSGCEPCTASLRLADLIQAKDWDGVDHEVMEHLPRFKVDALKQWLGEQSVPAHCINRVCVFLKHYDANNYEEATFIGVPLIDEIAKHLYAGKAFTTKRSNRRSANQSKPELAFVTTGGPDLSNYCKAFVQTFGSLQEDPNAKLLSDDNYWNRHAIVHGMMERPLGVKDAAKCLMAINFLISARKQADESNST